MGRKGLGKESQEIEEGKEGESDRREREFHLVFINRKEDARKERVICCTHQERERWKECTYAYAYIDVYIYRIFITPTV